MLRSKYFRLGDRDESGLIHRFFINNLFNYLVIGF